MLYSWLHGEENQHQRLLFTLIKVFNIPVMIGNTFYNPMVLKQARVVVVTVMIMQLLRASSSYLNESGLNVMFLQLENKPEVIYFIILKCFTTQKGGMVLMISCHL